MGPRLHPGQHGLRGILGQGRDPHPRRPDADRRDAEREQVQDEVPAASLGARRCQAEALPPQPRTGCAGSPVGSS